MKTIKLLLGSAVLLAFAGCTHQAVQTKTAANTNPNYVWYTPTGSNIPILVRKDSLTDRENTTQDQEAMRDATRRGLHMDRRGD